MISNFKHSIKNQIPIEGENKLIDESGEISNFKKDDD